MMTLVMEKLTEISVVCEYRVLLLSLWSVLTLLEISTNLYI
jgi:hypothetical protein